MRSYDTMSESERRELHKMLSGLSAVQPVSADVDEPDGGTPVDPSCGRGL